MDCHDYGFCDYVLFAICVSLNIWSGIATVLAEHSGSESLHLFCPIAATSHDTPRRHIFTVTRLTRRALFQC